MNSSFIKLALKYEIFKILKSESIINLISLRSWPILGSNILHALQFWDIMFNYFVHMLNTHLKQLK